MPKLGSVVTFTAVMGVFASSAGAQPAMQEQQPVEPAQQEQPPAPMQPVPGSTQATFISNSSEPWQVLIDRQPACDTPCSIYVPPMRFVTLRSRDQVLLEVGTLPQGSVVVRGSHLANGAYAGGIVGASFSGMGLVTGITLTAVGWGTGRDGMRTAGLITGGVSAVGLYLSIKLMQSAVPKVEVLPGRPYVSGNTVGLAGRF
jgi:hypothetical protein